MERGYVRVTAKDLYNARKGYGFLEESSRSFVLQAPRSDYKYRMPITEHFKNHGTAFLVDGVRSKRDILFRTDVPNGKYRVTVSVGDLLRPMGSISLYANRQLIEENIALHHGLYRGIRDQGNPARPSATGFYDRIRFTIEVDQGVILLRLAGHDYRSLRHRPRCFPGYRQSVPHLHWRLGGARRGLVNGRGNLHRHRKRLCRLCHKVLLQGVETFPVRLPPRSGKNRHPSLVPGDRR